MSKRELLDKLYEQYKADFEGQEIVLGDGNIDCTILLVGEAPGKDEVRLGKPFVGAAGKNLNEFLEALGINREKIYITNAIKYRLSEVNPETGRIVNRPAKKEEITMNREYLIKEVNIIKPQYVVTLGNVPLKSITGNYSTSIGTVHGQMQSVSLLENEYRLYPLYHPASIIYNQSLKTVYLTDIQRLGNIIET